jgi:hypothetical protein
MIIDNTNSSARVLHGAPRKPCYGNAFQMPTTTPRPAAVAAGKINSSTTLLRVHSGGLGFAPRYWALRVRRNIFFGSPIDFPRRCAAPKPCAHVPGPRLCCERRRAGFRLGCASGRGVVVGAGDTRKSQIRIPGSSGIRKENCFRVVRSTVESTRARKRSCPGRGDTNSDSRRRIE